jgi:uridylate kinase
MDKTKPIIISFGGSLVVPNGGIDIKYIAEFNAFIRKKVADGWRFFIVVGGGSTARHYIDGARGVIGDISDWDLDWLGIHTTRLNAHLIRTIFSDIAHPRIIQNYQKKINNLHEKIVVAAGWKPGCSTDFDAVYLAHDYQAEVVINMSNITSVYDHDPKKNPDAKPLHRLTWTEFEKLVGTKWCPGSNTPFDPIATKRAKELGLTVYVVGKDLENLDKILNGLDFTGTIISNE